MPKLPTSPPFSDFPSDVLKWMKKNATNPKTVLKLMQICKYFQHQEFPYFVVKRLFGYNWIQGWGYNSLGEDGFKVIPLKNVTKKIWITDYLQLRGVDDYQMQCFMQKIAVCDIKHLDFLCQIDITYEQFKIITAAGNVRKLKLDHTVIHDENSESIPLENIFDCVPKLTTLNIAGNCNSIASHQNATAVIPRNFKSFCLCNITNEFDINEYFKFLLNNQHVCFTFRIFQEHDSDFIKELQFLTDALIHAWSPNFKPPFIKFIGQTRKSKSKLKKMEKPFYQNNNVQKSDNFLSYLRKWI